MNFNIKQTFDYWKPPQSLIPNRQPVGSKKSFTRQAKALFTLLPLPTPGQFSVFFYPRDPRNPRLKLRGDQKRSSSARLLSSVPPGLILLSCVPPSFEKLGYCRSSLRDFSKGLPLLFIGQFLGRRSATTQSDPPPHVGGYEHRESPAAAANGIL
jgi:hypothetical protein